MDQRRKSFRTKKSLLFEARDTDQGPTVLGAVQTQKKEMVPAPGLSHSGLLKACVKYLDIHSTKETD